MSIFQFSKKNRLAWVYWSMFFALCLLMGCKRVAVNDKLLDEGVSWELAQYRKQSIKDLRYKLAFTIPEDKDAPVKANEQIRFLLDSPIDIILDFRESPEKIHQVQANGEPCKFRFVNDHLVIPSQYVIEGENTLDISFTAGNQSLNRRDGYVYTLFVPDRARTVFPCFEQPNLKARFDLKLDIPEHWKSVSNNCPDTPIPTYLFAFAAGDFQYQRYEEDGYSIGAFHRETDPARIAQLPDIMHQVIFSLKWLEEFTGVKYPFPKYDLVVLPGFQFGGMEHVGATFYNDNTLFLSQHPTPDELLRRTELISHETSHMWFGDAVTMEWFNDVWTKEVFANYFAAEITEPLFPNLNHELNWLRTYVNAAISQDRTEGRTSIRQPLDNMRYAGLIYNRIIYNKAPVMMRKMVELMGKDAFRRGIQRYVKTYLYGNATWDDLIEILDSETTADLKAFSRSWVDEANWPHHTASSINAPSLGMEYGYWDLTAEQCDSLLHEWKDMPSGTRRQALLMALNENYLNGKIGDVQWMSALTDYLANETDPLTALTLVGYMSEPIRYTFQKGEKFDLKLLEISKVHPLAAARTQIIRLLAGTGQTPEVIDSLYEIWNEAKNPLLSMNDYTNLAYELCIRKPRLAEDILSTQRARIDNPDRLAQFDYISPSVSPSQEARDSVFESLRLAENRRIEPWALSALYYLNHPLREKEAVKYIQPALEMLPDIQRTGDIFFPSDWCSSLLSGHRSHEASIQVQEFLKAHTSYPQLLTNKILFAKYHLDRATRYPPAR